jgi:pSer/pThr/pTyr-binding forkhead associated (FHA) protein
LRKNEAREKSAAQEEVRQAETGSYSQPVTQAPTGNLKRTMIAGGGAAPTLMVTAGTFSRNFTLDRPQLAIGRAAGNDIVIPEATVSGKHATITNEGGNFYLTDTGSTNGTFINKQRIQGRHLLKPGDTISMGAAQLTFAV